MILQVGNGSCVRVSCNNTVVGNKRSCHGLVATGIDRVVDLSALKLMENALLLRLAHQGRVQFSSVFLFRLHGVEISLLEVVLDVFEARSAVHLLGDCVSDGGVLGEVLAGFALRA